MHVLTRNYFGFPSSRLHAARRRYSHWLPPSLCFALLLYPCLVLGGVVSYTAIDIGTLGGSYNNPRSINDSGQVVGYSNNATNETRAYITGSNGAPLIDLAPQINSSSSYAYGVNASGQVVGDSASRAFITGPNGVGATYLGTLGGLGAIARDVNDSGQVVGYSNTSSGDFRAFITGANGVGMTDIGTLGVGRETIAWAVNSLGQVTGWSYIGNYPRAFITGPNGVGMTDLGNLGGNYVFAYDINDNGQVVGYSEAGRNDPISAFITGPNGVGMMALGRLNVFDTYSVAYGVNNIGQVVGHSGNGTNRAFVTGGNGVGMLDLNTLTVLPTNVYLETAWAINNLGQIVATDNNQRAYLLTPAPVPLPATAILLLSGTATLALIASLGQREAQTAASKRNTPRTYEDREKTSLIRV